MGFVTKNVPVSHPDFGKAFPCTCKQEELQIRRSTRLYQLSNLDALADKRFDTFILDPPGLTDDQLASLRAGSDLAEKFVGAA